MKKALVIYSTRSNETGRLAELIEVGIKSEGIDVMVAKVSEIEKKGIQLENCDALVLGSPTYKGEMLQEMKTFLFTLEAADLSSKVGGAFGAFGWSGEASRRIFDTMKNIFKMKMVDKPLRVKSSSETGGAIEAKKYGRDIAKIVRYGREIARMMQ
ncbi:Flavodoxin domain-containing protein [Syntrophus gentianae]|uniref:Flavodoxin domain-containing protein n=1 Tax=Syntrophus gentianae TaxID=43775 RepID=A0A1H7WQ61_9BACT|nr:flavodoxin domain-containing protein [Syntrophus gentianae]SEM23680.1 Flavodoxin domain-containing protein [Syntrophus gentianae]